MREHGFVYVVAPNESDHQLKFMESSGLVDFVLTEDTCYVSVEVSTKKAMNMFRTMSSVTSVGRARVRRERADALECFRC